MKWNDGVCELSKAELKMLLTFAHSDPVRKSLNQVCFCPESSEVVATDGHTLLMLKTIGSCSKPPFGVGFETLESMRSAMKARDNVLIGWHDDGEQLVLRCSALPSTLSVKPHQTSPPPYQDAIPAWSDEPRMVEPTGFDAQYLTRLALVQKTMGVKGMQCRFGEDDCSPSLFKCEADCVGATVVIMPMRI